MKFEYQFERKDFINYLKESNKKYNYICLIIFTLFYFGACLDLMSSNAVAVIISYLISILILFSLLKLITVIFVKVMVKRNDKVMEFAYGTYKVEITNKGIKEVINDKELFLAYEDIYRVSKNDKWLILFPKTGNIMYLFIKKLFTKPAVYEKSINMILTNYQKVKNGEEIKTPVKKESAKKDIKETRKKTSKKKAK